MAAQDFLIFCSEIVFGSYSAIIACDSMQNYIHSKNLIAKYKQERNFSAIISTLPMVKSRQSGKDASSRTERMKYLSSKIALEEEKLAYVRKPSFFGNFYLETPQGPDYSSFLPRFRNYIIEPSTYLGRLAASASIRLEEKIRGPVSVSSSKSL